LTPFPASSTEEGGNLLERSQTAASRCRWRKRIEPLSLNADSDGALQAIFLFRKDIIILAVTETSETPKANIVARHGQVRRAGAM
jgi:hypothetical protein